MELDSEVGGTERDRTWRVIRPSGRRPRLNILELWRNRELAIVLARRDLALRYRQTLFGIGWAVLQPLLAVGIFSVVFGSVAGIGSDGAPYAVFAFAGMAIWFFVSSATSSAAESLVDNPDLVSKVWFPRLIAPAAAVFASVLDLVIASVLAAIAMVAYGVAPAAQIVFLPVFALGAVAIAAGAGFWLCAANVLYRDVRYALPFLMQIWLFVSPVVFPMSLVDDELKYVLALNPVAGVLEGWRWALIDGPAPGPWIAVSAATLIVLLASGLLYFRHAERTFADKI